MEQGIEGRRSLPDVNRLSVISATILLAYALVPYIDIPGRNWDITVMGAIFSFRLNFSVLITILVALMAAAGMEWLLRSHPFFGGQNTFQHRLLPALTALVIGFPLNSIGVDQRWWAVFSFGSIFLILVFVAEFIVLDLGDGRHAIATMGLTGVSFALYLFLCIAIRGAEIRSYLVFPALSGAMLLVALRTLYLRLDGRWCVRWSIGIALVVGQLSVALHYFSLTPLAYGLVLLGPAYALTGLVSAIEERRPWRSLWIEPISMMVILTLLAISIGR
jgi:hypothetical protein